MRRSTPLSRDQLDAIMVRLIGPESTRAIAQAYGHTWDTIRPQLHAQWPTQYAAIMERRHHGDLSHRYRCMLTEAQIAERLAPHTAHLQGGYREGWTVDAVGREAKRLAGTDLTLTGVRRWLEATMPAFAAVRDAHRRKGPGKQGKPAVHLPRSQKTHKQAFNCTERTKLEQALTTASKWPVRTMAELDAATLSRIRARVQVVLGPVGGGGPAAGRTRYTHQYRRW